MKINKKIILAIFLFLPLFALAADLNYTPMEPIPIFGSSCDFYVYVVNFYKLGLALVGISAMLMIMIGGYMYATSAGNNAAMEKAKGVITDAIVGLILALMAWLILFIINPDLVNITKITTSSSCTGGSGSPVTTTTTNPDGSKKQTEVCPGGNGTPPNCSPGATSGNCHGIPTQAGIAKTCGDASPELTSFLECINKTGANYQISSISDSQNGLSCRINPNSSCAHGKNGSVPSCHYCKGGSRAVDFSNRGAIPTDQQIKDCGGTPNPESSHMHVNVSCSSAAACYN